jgi:hypothetical protein
MSSLFSENLSCQVKAYVEENLKKVKYIRTPSRQGLIRARMVGANQSKGQV